MLPLWHGHRHSWWYSHPSVLTVPAHPWAELRWIRELLISKVLTAARELKNKLFHEAIEKEYGNKADVKEESITNADITPVAEEVTKTEMTTVTETTVTKTEVIEAPKPQIPPRPVMPPEAAAYPKLRKIKTALDKQNETIFEAERERNALEFERNDLRGFIKLTKKKSLTAGLPLKRKKSKS